MNCRLCGKSTADCSGWLQRVNPFGLPGIWECRPGCNAPAMSSGDALIAAIESPVDHITRFGAGEAGPTPLTTT